MTLWTCARTRLTRQDALDELAVLEAEAIPAHCPELAVPEPAPALEYGRFDGYRIFVPETWLEPAHGALGLSRGRAETAYPCPNCGAASRKERRISVIIAAAWAFGWIFPFLKRRRICPACRTRFMPAPIEPFTEEELGYAPPNSDMRSDLEGVLEWARGIGYQDETASTNGDQNDEPSRRIRSRQHLRQDDPRRDRGGEGL